MGVRSQISVHVKKALAALIVPPTRLNWFSMLAQVSFGTDVYVCLHTGAEVLACVLELVEVEL